MKKVKEEKEDMWEKVGCERRRMAGKRNKIQEVKNRKEWKKYQTEITSKIDSSSFFLYTGFGRNTSYIYLPNISPT